MSVTLGGTRSRSGIRDLPGVTYSGVRAAGRRWTGSGQLCRLLRGGKKPHATFLYVRPHVLGDPFAKNANAGKGVPPTNGAVSDISYQEYGEMT